MFSFLQSVVYLRLSPQQVFLRNPRTGAAFTEPALVAIEGNTGRPRVAAVGTAARLRPSSSDTTIVQPFAHPRSIISDFTVGQQLLKLLLRQFQAGSWFRMAPHIVIHPLGEHVGGLTQVEIRALHELALGCGASGVTVWQGPVLTDAELLARRFPPEGCVLS